MALYDRPQTSAANFDAANLVIQDFDGTVAHTFEKSPNGVGVEEAYELTIESMFGVRALQQYIQSGGLVNRAPIEIVESITQIKEHDEIQKLTTVFTGIKLGILLNEIGTRFPDGQIWPRPTAGYFEFCEKVDQARSTGRCIDDLILSSGHEPFIKKTYDAWSIRRPSHILAEERVRILCQGQPTEILVKPHPNLINIALAVWRQSYAIESPPQDIHGELDRIVYVGDDPVKDGELAKKGGIKFMLLNPEKSSETWNSVASHLGLGQLEIQGKSSVDQ